MRSLSSLVVLAGLAVHVAGRTLNIVPPASRGDPVWVANTLDPNDGMTDAASITSTVAVVQQKGGAGNTTPPDKPVSDTVVTAVDGRLTLLGNMTQSPAHKRGEWGIMLAEKRSDNRSVPVRAGYTQIFAGTGTGPSDRDAAIQGTAYLTYTLVPNSTYNVDACLDYCDRTERCVFVNLYYEFNNELLDHVFSEHSNLKCVAYGDVHFANEKTNWGGQQSLPPPAPVTYIQQSSGYAVTLLANPSAPDGYEFVFGPTNGANNAPGYMGFSFLDRYDVVACAQQCNTRTPDPVGGACLYFNIWRALVNGVPTTYTCSMYYLPTDETTAVNHQQGDIQVTFSRGYRRKSYVVDGGFEGYIDCLEFCYTESYLNWVGTSPENGTQDATIFNYRAYAHFGHGVGLLGSAVGVDGLPGTLSPRRTLYTDAGHTYQIAFFHSSTFSGAKMESDAFVQVMWNKEVVGTVRPGYQAWTFYSFVVTAVGGDQLAFRGGRAPAWSFLDDIFVLKV
ncbi:hypothetical protein APHAL10511_002998 [Amanita phalloides]|nr:hypothetical protein APHAL10511_002998 [Amanita phalloides]